MTVLITQLMTGLRTGWAISAIAGLSGGELPQAQTLPTAGPRQGPREF